MGELSERYRKGAETYAEVYPGSASDDPSDFETVAMENLFAEIWQRPGLSTRDRRLLILGIVAAQGNETILKLQFRSGLDKGDLTRTDLTEIPIFLSQYAGFPLSVVANNVARRVLKELED